MSSQLKKVSLENDVTVIYVKTSASNRRIKGRRHRYSSVNRSKYIKLIHSRLDEISNSMDYWI